MYDDDGELYYEGRASSQSFEALDCFGMPNAGATEIRFYNKETRKFETI